MNEILLSDVSGKIPSVNQLEITKHGLGFNRADGILYGLKITSGVKEVIVLAQAVTPGQIHQQLHEMDSEADHAPADAADYGKYLRANPVTGAPEWFTSPENFWEKVASGAPYFYLRPLNYAYIQQIKAKNFQADDTLGATYDANNRSVLSAYTLIFQAKIQSMALTFMRWGNVIGSIIQGTDIIGAMTFMGFDGTTMQKGAEIEVKAGPNNWSATERGTQLDIKTARTGTTALVTRVQIDENANTVINEDGEATDFRVEGDNDQNLLLVKGNVDRVGVGTNSSVDAKLHIKTSSTEGTEVQKLEQLDEDKPFIHFKGTSAADTTKNISTMNGAGNVAGPKGQSGTEDHWRYVGMVKQKVNDQEYWMPYYEPVPGT